MTFTKMHGCGNDFIVIDEHDGRVEIDAAQTRALCDRRTGVGADGILVIGSPKGARWPLVIHNANGSIAEACGNGSRCVARYVLEGYGGEALELDTKSGVVRAWRDPEGYAIELDAPQLGSELRIAVGGREYEARAVRVGNPNVVVFVDDPATLDLEALAAASTALAGPANVAAAGRRRGGGGAAAGRRRGGGGAARSPSGCPSAGSMRGSAVARAPTPRSRPRRPRGDVTSDTVRVRLPGGTLVVRARGARYELAGPAEYVFTAEA